MSLTRAVRHGPVRREVHCQDGGRQRSKTLDRKSDAAAMDREMSRRKQLGADTPVEPARVPVDEWLLQSRDTGAPAGNAPRGHRSHAV